MIRLAIIAMAIVSSVSAFGLPSPVHALGASCSTFDSQVWAQSVYDTDPGAYADLDPDGNGVACEKLPLGAAPSLWTDTIPADAEPAQLVGVTDGDTIQALVNGANEPIRLILIDTPETHDPNDPPECYGQEATDYLTWLLSLGGDLYLERDVSERDRYDRLLRYAWLDFGGGEVYLVNEVMARSGYAAQSTYPPDVKYEAQIREAVAFAREHGYGLWAGCSTDAGGDTNELTGSRQGIAAPAAQPEPVRAAPSSDDCDPSYPEVCIPPTWVNGDLNCKQIAFRRFTVLPPDPHNFDGDFDGVGCER